MVQVTKKVNTSKQGFNLRVTWTIECTLPPLSNEGDNIWNESSVSLQLLSPSIERGRRVHSMVQVTRKVNPYFEVFTFRVIWTIEFTLLLLSIEADNNWHESCVSFQLFSASIERRRRVNSMIQTTRKVNTLK